MMRVPDILVAEDDSNDVFLLQRALATAAPSLSALYFEDGQGVLDYLQGKPPFADRPEQLPAMLLLDIKMPTMCGFEVLAFLSRHPRLRPRTVAVFSSSPLEADHRFSAELGADLYFVKPAGFADLCQMVRCVALFLGTGAWGTQPATIINLRAASP